MGVESVGKGVREKNGGWGLEDLERRGGERDKGVIDWWSAGL